MKLFRNILLSFLLIFSNVGYSQNNLISNNSNDLIRVGNSLLYFADFDVDAQLFFDTIDARGGSLTGNEKYAINAYVIAAKNDANAWWNDTHADYPMVGNTAISCAVNLRNPGTFDLTFANTVAGDFTNTGWTPNGTTSYGRTALTPSTTLTLNSVALEYYSRTNIGEASNDMGCQNGSTQRILMFIRHTAALETFFDCYNTTTGRINVDQPSSLGGYSFVRRSSTDAEVYRNGVSYGSIATGGGTQPTFEIYIGAQNNTGSPIQFNTKETAGAGIFDGLTTAKVLAQYTARQGLNQKLGREVN